MEETGDVGGVCTTTRWISEMGGEDERRTEDWYGILAQDAQRQREGMHFRVRRSNTAKISSGSQGPVHCRMPNLLFLRLSGSSLGVCCGRLSSQCLKHACPFGPSLEIYRYVSMGFALPRGGIRHTVLARVYYH